MVYAFEHPAVESQGLDEMEAYNARQQALRSQVSPNLASRLLTELRDEGEAWLRDLALEAAQRIEAA